MSSLLDETSPNYHHIVQTIREQFPSITGKVHAFKDETPSLAAVKDAKTSSTVCKDSFDDLQSATSCCGDDDSDAPAHHHLQQQQQPWVYFENAGGSQVPKQVAQAVYTYMLTTYVQIGAGYHLSTMGALNVQRAHAFVELIMNASGSGMAILGSSTTSLIYMVADAMRDVLKKGDEIVVSQAAHESNVTPWLALERQLGTKLVIWPVDTESLNPCPLDTLAKVLSPATKLVIFPHVSNLLGQVVDIHAIAKHIRTHAPGAQILVDGVAYAPHHVIDVQSWDVDWYVYSTYKVYGPHMAAMFARRSATEPLEGLNHFFVPKNIPYKFELGGVSHEGCAAINGLIPYLKLLATLAGHSASSTPTSAEVFVGITRGEIVAAFELMTALERPLVRKLVRGLEDMSSLGIRIISAPADFSTAESTDRRIGTVAFCHDSILPEAITQFMAQFNIAMRHGHMYSYRLCKAIGVDISRGVARVSLSHYNTLEEVDKFLKLLRTLVTM